MAAARPLRKKAHMYEPPFYLFFRRCIGIGIAFARGFGMEMGWQCARHEDGISGALP